MAYYLLAGAAIIFGAFTFGAGMALLGFSF